MANGSNRRSRSDGRVSRVQYHQECRNLVLKLFFGVKHRWVAADYGPHAKCIIRNAERSIIYVCRSMAVGNSYCRSYGGDDNFSPTLILQEIASHRRNMKQQST
ncbi:PREDICTED: uncharacterized protein LOC106745688 [Dinoponera quadriceps]|uniref:Uncharacterized protein LOC106745688 n=1 Tax=Dinoponera quadriceps TaxID=609295 RepID=A0A6P3XG02_DINQU|nr:PREDICTED: uncharacterized protein LOC106745688 [Dinoponera quadriceps]